MIIKCKQCGLDFEFKEENLRYFEIHDISAPKFCHLCSWQRKLSWENEYRVYKRDCDATGESMISVYNVSAPFPVYKREFWITDKWELPKMNYDKNRSFLEQYFELFKKVPRPNANCVNAENSEYSNLVFDSKSCYLTFQAFLSERLIGCYRVIRMRDSAYSFFCMDSELLYECANCYKSYNLKFCADSENCSDSAFLYDCKGCRNCFLCANLRNKEYFFKNEKCTKEQYAQKLKEYDLSKKEGQLKAKKEFDTFRKNFIVKANSQINCEKCDGDYLVGCKNSTNIYFSDGCEDSVNVLRGTEDIDSFDAVVGGKIELCLNLLQPGYSYKCAFTIDCNHCRDTYFSESLDDCENCLGCISLKRGKFCILNKQYSEEEYADLKKHIFAELRVDNSFEDFFDPEKSPFKYEETIADLYFPKAQLGGESAHEGEGVCKFCGKSLNFTAAEKVFLTKMKLAAPDYCFYCGILRLAKPYSVVQMKKTNCNSCGKEISAGGSLSMPGKLYCNECYLKTVY